MSSEDLKDFALPLFLKCPFKLIFIHLQNCFILCSETYAVTIGLEKSLFKLNFAVKIKIFALKRQNQFVEKF